MVHQVEASKLKKDDYVMMDGEPCIVKEASTSAPGKHGHAKTKIRAEGVFDGRGYNDTVPGDHKMMKPKINKRKGQIVSMDGQMAQVMDLDSYETEEMQLPEDVNVAEGEEIKYWEIEGRTLVKGKGN